jgi:hypothetical protein
MLGGTFIGACSDRVNGSPCRIAEQDCMVGLACIEPSNTALGTCASLAPNH